MTNGSMVQDQLPDHAGGTDSTESSGSSSASSLMSSSADSSATDPATGMPLGTGIDTALGWCTATTEATATTTTVPSLPQPQPQPQPQEEEELHTTYYHLYNWARNLEDYSFLICDMPNSSTHVHVDVVPQDSILHRLSSYSQLTRPLCSEPRWEDVDESEDEEAGWEGYLELRRSLFRPVDDPGPGQRWRMSAQDRRNERHNRNMLSIRQYIGRRLPQHMQEYLVARFRL